MICGADSLKLRYSVCFYKQMVIKQPVYPETQKKWFIDAMVQFITSKG